MPGGRPLGSTAGCARTAFAKVAAAVTDAGDDLDTGDRTAFVLGGPLRWRTPTRGGVLAVGVILLAVAIPLRGMYRATGSSMEEGFMLLFPELLREGWTPNVDFLHLYGPGSLHALAGWYELFGNTLASERTFGLLQHLGIIFGIYALARAWGRAAAAVCALIAVLFVLTPIGLSALAWHGGVALGLWAVVFALRAQHTAAAAESRSWAAAGLLAGVALTFRPDLIVALGMPLGWLAWRARHAVRPLVTGGVAGLVGFTPMIVHVGIVGPATAWNGMVVDPVFRLRAGRELPRPPTWSHVDGALQWIAEAIPPWWGLPAPQASHQLFLWFFAVGAITVAVPLAGLRALRRTPARPAAVTLLAAGLFGLGILHQGLQRPDSTHLAWVAFVSFSIAPAAIVEAWPRGRVRATRRVGIAAAAMAVLLAVVCPFFTYRYYVHAARVSAGDAHGGFTLQRGDRRFHLGDFLAYRAASNVVADLDQMASPGERLLVGPADLSRTMYSDVYFYWLFPELEPATYFIEMDPGLANAEGSRLAGDVASADWLILTNFWNGWYEPNDSIVPMSQAANQVVAERFCLVKDYEDALVLLYQRCAVGDGVSPAEVGARPGPVGDGAP